ncbi:hypothetical protein P792_03660 [Asaia sp. SF2.1]|nr:hypothetical protein P792_03660 [Asaia sp. SF2.1]
MLTKTKLQEPFWKFGVRGFEAVWHVILGRDVNDRTSMPENQYQARADVLH